MPNELKPCPFCGNTEILSGYLNYNPVTKEDYDWDTSCTICDIGFIEKTQKEAEDKWNTRKIKDSSLMFAENKDPKNEDDIYSILTRYYLEHKIIGFSMEKDRAWVRLNQHQYNSICLNLKQNQNIVWSIK